MIESYMYNMFNDVFNLETKDKGWHSSKLGSDGLLDGAY